MGIFPSKGVVEVVSNSTSDAWGSILLSLTDFSRNYQFKHVEVEKVSESSKKAIYLISVSTPRLDLDEQRLNRLKEKTPNVLLCVARYGTNPDAFPTFFEDPKVTAQILHNGKNLINCDLNTQNVTKLEESLKSLG